MIRVARANYPQLQSASQVVARFSFAGEGRYRASDDHGRDPMNSLTLSELARTKPGEVMLEHEIQMRAYELYERRGGGAGFALQDWLQAEAEVLARCYPPAHS
jgi:hypothetical protein